MFIKWKVMIERAANSKYLKTLHKKNRGDDENEKK